jgi:hypothetical protein
MALGFIEIEQKSSGFLDTGTTLKNPNFAAAEGCTPAKQFWRESYFVFSFIDGVIANYRMYGFAVSNAGPNQEMACNLAAQVTRAKQLGLPDPSGFAVSLFCSPKTYWSYGADQTFMFADTVHPTTHLGALFALFVEQQIAARGWGWDRIAESVGN